MATGTRKVTVHRHDSRRPPPRRVRHAYKTLSGLRGKVKFSVNLLKLREDRT